MNKSQNTPPTQSKHYIPSCIWENDVETICSRRKIPTKHYVFIPQTNKYKSKFLLLGALISLLNSNIKWGKLYLWDLPIWYYKFNDEVKKFKERSDIALY